MFEEENVTGPNIAMNDLDFPEMLAALQDLLKESELLIQCPGPICLSSVLCDLEECRVGALEKKHQRLLVRVNSINKRILKRKEKVPLLPTYFFLMHPYFLQPSLKGQAIITTKRDQSQTVLNSCKLIFGCYHGIGESVVGWVDEYLFDNVQFIVDVDCSMRDLVENGEGDLKFVMVLNFEGEDVGRGI